jgi:hypothetical protein
MSFEGALILYLSKAESLLILCTSQFYSKFSGRPPVGLNRNIKRFFQFFALYAFDIKGRKHLLFIRICVLTCASLIIVKTVSLALNLFFKGWKNLFVIIKIQESTHSIYFGLMK